MPEMAHTGKDHGHIVFVGCSDDFFIAHGATGLDYRTNPCLVRGIDAVTEGEEGVRGHHGARYFQPLVLGLGQAVQVANLMLGIDETAGLPLEGWMP